VSAPVVKQVALTTPPAQKHLSNYLKDARIPTDSDTAMQRLFYRWGIDYDHQSGRTACERALNAGLRCIYDTGTWNNVWTYNRPAVIELVDSDGDRHHVLVSALNRDSVTLALGDSDYDFPLSEVDRYWFGKFLLLWNPQKLNQGNLHYGMRGESVLWLRDVLARYKGASSQMEQSDFFDAKLESQIIEFQKDHHLSADGIVGELTMLKLNSYNPQGRPPMLVDATGTGVE
jgi:general secretion pathway protein A